MQLSVRTSSFPSVLPKSRQCSAANSISNCAQQTGTISFSMKNSRCGRSEFRLPKHATAILDFLAVRIHTVENPAKPFIFQVSPPVIGLHLGRPARESRGVERAAAAGVRYIANIIEPRGDRELRQQVEAIIDFGSPPVVGHPNKPGYFEILCLPNIFPRIGNPHFYETIRLSI